MTETMKFWLRNLYLREAEEHRGAASNWHLAALGSEGESAVQCEEYAEENREFADILEKMAKEINF
jgi:hypothetical protein